ncbi:hypothetical protein FACS1894166_01900 [Bacilli bacterium]|nr:hypothetical protein FACS1894166_01900 [Bacilli bacterium]
MIKPEIGLERIRTNTLREYNRLDQEKMKLHNKVYEGYQKIIKENRDRHIVEIDANADINTVFDKVYALILKAIMEHYGE